MATVWSKYIKISEENMKDYEQAALREQMDLLEQTIQGYHDHLNAEAKKPDQIFRDVQEIMTQRNAAVEKGADSIGLTNYFVEILGPQANSL